MEYSKETPSGSGDLDTPAHNLQPNRASIEQAPIDNASIIPQPTDELSGLSAPKLVGPRNHKGPPGQQGQGPASETQQSIPTAWSTRRLFTLKAYFEAAQDLRAVVSTSKETVSLVWSDAKKPLLKVFALEAFSNLIPTLMGGASALSIGAIQTQSKPMAVLATAAALATGLIVNWVGRSRRRLENEFENVCSRSIHRQILKASLDLSANTLDQKTTQEEINYVKDKHYQTYRFLNQTVGTLAGGVAVISAAAALLSVSKVAGLVVLSTGVPLLLAAREKQKAWTTFVDQFKEPSRRFYRGREQLLDEKSAKETRLLGCGPEISRQTMAALQEGHQVQSDTIREVQKIDLWPNFGREIATGFGLAYSTYLAFSGSISLVEFTFASGAIYGLGGTISQLCLSLGGQLELSSKLEPQKVFMQKGKIDRKRDYERNVELDWSKPPTIEFRNVSFTYCDSEAPTLHDISFKILPGEYLLIVGENEAGKSTLLSLLCGLYDPSSGQILINGIDSRKISRSSFQEGTSVVSQDFPLFDSFSVRENLDYGRSPTRRGLDTDAIAREYGIFDSIKNVPEGIDPLSATVGKGYTLKYVPSGGARQRFAIARGAIRDPKLLILDEPFSALDQGRLDRLSKSFAEPNPNQTRILITHDLVEGLACERIIELEHGRIVADDTPTQLLKSEHSFFAKAVRRKAKKLNSLIGNQGAGAPTSEDSSVAPDRALRSPDSDCD